MHFIGIDGGGSYSRLVGIKEDGTIIGKHAGNAADFDRFSYDGVKSNMNKLLREYNKLTNTKAEDCKAICICIPGRYDSSRAATLQKALLENDIQCPVKVVPDKAALIAAETKGRPGIGLMAGINVTCFALEDDDSYHQIGDYGYIIEDGGSTYKIGLEAIRAALRCSDGLIPHTVLLERVKEFFSLEDVRVLTEYSYEKLDKVRVSELFMTVKYAAQQSDHAAVQIEDCAAKDLFTITKAMIEKLNFADKQVVLSGGVLLANEYIQNMYRQLLFNEYPLLGVMTLREKPELGAAYLAAGAAEH